MGIFRLFITATFPVLNVLLVTGIGLCIATDYVGILGELARNNLNDVVYYVFNPALVASNLSKSLTPQITATSWFISANILLTFIFGSIFGLIIVRVTKTPSHLKGLTLCCCAAGNVGNMLLIILPDSCKEKHTPFGDRDVCNIDGIAYASLSLAINQILTWLYVYNIVKRSAKNEKVHSAQQALAVQSPEAYASCSFSTSLENGDKSLVSVPRENEILTTSQVVSAQKKVFASPKERQLQFRTLCMICLKYTLTPSTVGVIVGLIIGLSYPLKKLLVGENPPLRVIQNSTTLLGSAAIPTMTLVMGGNFIKGLRRASISPKLVVSVIAVRYILLPSVGVGIVKGAVRYGILHDDPLYQFTLLLHYALPPSVYIGTITQYFGSSESECAIIFLWSFVSALVFLPAWLTYFMWLVS